MQAIHRWALAFAFAVASLATSVAGAATYTALNVFSDSLSDPGNASALTGGPAAPFFPPFPPYVNGHFSNGPTAAEYLAGTLGTTVSGGWPTAAGANNMAVGGALTGSGNFNFLINSPAGLGTNPAYATVGVTGIAQQVAAFNAANPGALAGAQKLTLLWGGPNDFFLGFAQAQAGVPVDFAALTTQAVFNMAGNVAALATAGAVNILIPNMPDLGATPLASKAGAAFAAQATALSDAFNFGLAQAIAQASTSLGPLGVNLYQFDTAAYLRSVIATPPTGITNVAQACTDNIPDLLAGCTGYLFFDDVHPTTAAHALLADQFYMAAVPEPGTWLLLVAGLGLLGAVVRRRPAPRSGPRSAPV